MDAAATEAAIAAWHGIATPNPQGSRFVADLAQVIAAFEKVRGQAVFEDEPSSFEQALREARE